MTPALELHDVTSGYDSSIVVRNVSLSLAQGEILALVGKNGMGKSSLLKTILGYLPARTGQILLAGQDVTGLPPYLKSRMTLAYAPQEQALFQDLSVRDNLRLGLPRDRDLAGALEKITGWFPVLTQRLRQRAGTLSGGEQKMLIVARGLIAEPRVLLLDEVTEGLQPSVVDRLAEVLSQARAKQNIAIVAVEQHIPFALSLADHFTVFKGGEIVESGRVNGDSASLIEAYMRL